MVGREEPHGCGLAKQPRSEGGKMSNSKINKDGECPWNLGEYDAKWSAEFEACFFHDLG